MENITIRDAKRADLPEIGRILAANYHDTYGAILDRRILAYVNEESSTARMESYWLAPGTEMLVAVKTADDGSEAICAFSAGTPSPDVLGAFWLEMLHVEADRRGEGLGRALLFAMGKRARDTGYSQMTIDVFAGNDRAESIYRHYGAELVKEYRQDVFGFGVSSRLLIWEDLNVFA